MAKANSTRVTRSAPSTALNEKAITEIGNDFEAAYGQLEAAAAIINAVGVLCALERVPAHHDTHPSHNIVTGAGYAHGKRCFSDTLPRLMEHVHYLVSISMNDFDVLRENAINALREGGAA